MDRPNLRFFSIAIFGAALVYICVDLITGGTAQRSGLNLPILGFSAIIMSIAAFFLSSRKVNNH